MRGLDGAAEVMFVTLHACPSSCRGNVLKVRRWWMYGEQQWPRGKDGNERMTGTWNITWCDAATLHHDLGLKDWQQEVCKHTTSSVKPSSQIYTTCVCWDTEELGFVLEKLQCGVFSTKWSTTNHFWLWLLQAAHLNHSRRQRKRKELLRLPAQQPLMSSVSKPE